MRTRVGRLCPALVAMIVTVLGSLGVGRAGAAVVFSNYGPGGAYNPTIDPGTTPTGALWGYNGITPPYDGTIRNIRYLASFTVGDQDVVPTSITMSVRTHHPVAIDIYKDAGGVPDFGAGELTFGRAGPLGASYTETARDGTYAMPLASEGSFDPEAGDFLVRLRKGQRYWVMFSQVYERFVQYGPEDNRMWTQFYRSSNDPAEASQALYAQDRTRSDDNRLYAITGARPVFMIEGDVVPEPTTVAAGVAIASVLLRRRRPA